MNKSLNDWTHKELMALPVREWNADSEYDSLMVVSTRKKHDSGWSMIAIIGVIKSVPIEIAVSCCDDIEWKFPAMRMIGTSELAIGQLRTDCAFKSGSLHFWTRGSRFRVGIALSSTTVEMI